MTPDSPENPPQHTDALDEQLSYFATRRPVRMLALDTPYIHRHFGEAMDAAALPAGAAVCEWGAGLGRFTRLLLAQGLSVTAIELSPELTKTLRENLEPAAARLSIHCGDVAEVMQSGIEEMDAVIGFFVLHHLPELERYFRAASASLRPGGRMVFVEPNPFHPLYPVQIGVTPGMRWSAERGMYRLTPGRLRRAAAAAGFPETRIARYGALPRAIYNWAASFGGERLTEKVLPQIVRPFQVITLLR